MELLRKYTLSSKKLLGLAILLAVINQIFSLLDPQIMRILIDDYATNFGEFNQSGYLQGVGVWLMALVATALISRTAKAFQDYYVNVLTESVGTELYADAIKHVFDLPFSSLEDQRSGSILLNIEKARDDSKKFLTSLINDVFLSLIAMVFVLVYAYLVHPHIFSTFVLLIPVVGLTTFFLSKKIRAAQQVIVAQSADLAGSATETIRNISLVKALGLVAQEVARLLGLNEKVLSLELKKVVLLRTLTFIQGTLVNLVRVLVLFVTLYLIFTGDITLGEFTIFIFYTFYVFGPLYNLSTVLATYQQAKASNEELEKILSLPKSDYETGEQQVNLLQKIVLDEVSYKYPSSDQTAVSQISLEIKPGKTVAFVGPSGSGKSTLIKLLVGLYQPTAGQLQINDISADLINFSTYRHQIGYVSQDTQLFSGTIRENLRFVKPEATDQEIVQVLRQSQAEGLLSRGDKETGIGLDATIGETGIKLSGGERQRLAIARSLLRDPGLLIFDEATSALDSLTERQIVQTIKLIRKSNPNLMIVQIAHRLSTIMDSDKILVLRAGKIIEQGNHEELISRDSLYRAMWRQQTG